MKIEISLNATLLISGIVFLGSGLLEMMFGLWNSDYWYIPCMSIITGSFLLICTFISKDEFNQSKKGSIV